MNFSIHCPTQIRFGAGRMLEAAELAAEAGGPVVLVTGRAGAAAEPLRAKLMQARTPLIELRAPSEPSVDDIRRHLKVLRGADARMVLACGGGSVIDTGKSIAALAHAPADVLEYLQGAQSLNGVLGMACVAVPTTAGTGAEVTRNAVIGVPELGAKISLRGEALYPSVAIIDPASPASAPAPVSLASGLDAVTQLIEAYISSAATPFSDALALPMIKPGLRALRSIIEAPSATAWEQMAWASLSSGLALANSGLGAAHGIASVLGGRFNAPHGAVCGLLLPFVLDKNGVRAAGSEFSPRISFCVEAIAEVFPNAQGDPLSGFVDWIDAAGLPRLESFGVTKADHASIAQACQSASSMRKNPVPLSNEDLCWVLAQAS